MELCLLLHCTFNITSLHCCKFLDIFSNFLKGFTVLLLSVDIMHSGVVGDTWRLRCAEGDHDVLKIILL